MVRSLSCSIGIMAYNEAANIGNAIDAILRQNLVEGCIAEVVVVASGCTDQTVPIVNAIAREDSRVRLIIQTEREGKAAAINLFLAAAQSPILLMVSADVRVKDGAIDAMLHHFHDPTVGMVGGHPIPINDEGTFLGHTVHLLWHLHDRIAREAPKLGEMVAFRNVVHRIPLDTPVDEISIQALVTQLDYTLVYESQAIVYNRGPATVGDFLRQRRRIYAGHLHIRKQQGYAASTMEVGLVMRSLFALHPFMTPRSACWTIGAVGLEASARMLGYYDYLLRRPHHIWQMVSTTKADIASGASNQSHESVLVFRIVNFHEHELELGAHAAKQLTHQIMQSMRRALGSAAIVSVRPSGTIVAILAAPREEAEDVAHELMHEVEGGPVHFNGHHDGVSVSLACGIIAFSRTGSTQALSVPSAVEETA